MIIKDKTDVKTEVIKSRLGLTGDVYIDENRHIESLESHRLLLSSYGVTPTATTIEEAETERIAFEEEMAARRAAEANRLTLEDALEMLNELGVSTDD